VIKKKKIQKRKKREFPFFLGGKKMLMGAGVLWRIQGNYQRKDELEGKLTKKGEMESRLLEENGLGERLTRYL